MSAFIVSREHIHYLVEAARTLPSRNLQGGTLHWYFGRESRNLRAGECEKELELGQTLWDENIRSVLACYQGETRKTAPGPVGESFVYDKHSYSIRCVDPVQVLKACDGYTYQSCEHEGWEFSEAHAIIEAIRHAAIHALPGYDEAQWSL